MTSNTVRTSALAPWRLRGAMLLGRVLEVGVLALVCLSAWAFGAVEPELEFLLYAGLAVLLAVWGVRTLIEGRLRWTNSPLALCLAGLFLVGVVQVIPLPERVLSALAPATVAMYERVLPRRPEVLSGDEPRTALFPPPGTTLSLYPAATRLELERLLALFLVFALVRNSFASAESLRRLAVVALVNGALLSLFAILQFFTSEPGMLYWSLRSPGRVFGPFINRNHYAFYANICLGLGLGLFLSRRQAHAGGTRGRPGGVRPRSRGLSAAGPAPLIQDSPALWMAVALGVLASSVLLSMSRGGVLALLAACCICVTLQLWRSPQALHAGAVAITLIVALGLVHWFGVNLLESRLGTIWTGEAFQGNRSELWWRVLPLARDYPLLGTGYGTFPNIEPLYRQTALAPDSSYTHAHNEYLEALVEGGAARLLITAVAVGIALWLAYRAFRRHAGAPAAGLALGVLFALTTMVTHSFIEFAVHVPAIALLGAVLGAQACALANDAAARRAGEPAAPRAAVYSLRFFGLAPLAGALTAVLLGFGLVQEGWTAAIVQSLRRDAQMIARSSDEGARDRQVAYLDAAGELAPSFARLQVERADAHRDAYVEGLAALDPELSDDALQQAEQELMRQDLVPALRFYLQARDACPLFGQAQVGIAAHADTLAEGDTTTAYLERAKLLIPYDPQVWYLFGLQEALGGEVDEACRSWRRSLELGDAFLADITRAADEAVGPEGLIERVLPPKPQQFAQAATYLYPKPEQASEREPFLTRALELVPKQPAETAADRHLEATILRSLGRDDEAAAAYADAVAREPYEVSWRYEYAELLCELGKSNESYQQLLALIRQQHDHPRARQLLDRVARDLEGKP